ncbi:hypothetical protein FHJ30_17475 [Arthrobacter sp. BB-1]|uniref:hypothetical protein n=1 Tax=unclassified Arthrobacter TaxID=235627 RepID=UPI0010E8B85F|nr:MULTISPECIES: hypothetical protein [unclassified Arthrobacter]TNB69740.1 hypothetical protein FHJ30_17475 [Arthrobacter sp. BB-1]VII97899.1 hypothetical protein [Arthrobacter sp. DR-2P]
MEEDTEVQGHRAYVGTTSEGEAAIGRIAIWAATVEENLESLCVRLINSGKSEVGYAVTANMSASSIILLARKLLTDSKTVSDEDKAEVLVMLTEAKAALEQRNKILHGRVGELMFEGKTTFFHRRKKGSGPAGEAPGWFSTSLREQELDEIGARLFDVSEDLWGYLNLPTD